jgi:hypothetical protein
MVQCTPPLNLVHAPVPLGLSWCPVSVVINNRRVRLLASATGTFVGQRETARGVGQRAVELALVSSGGGLCGPVNRSVIDNGRKAGQPRPFLRHRISEAAGGATMAMSVLNVKYTQIAAASMGGTSTEFEAHCRELEAKWISRRLGMAAAGKAASDRARYVRRLGRKVGGGHGAVEFVNNAGLWGAVYACTYDVIC